jgi:hypothetical protein
MKDYEHIALCFAEEYGIIEYHVKGNEMIFYTSFPLERMTYKAVVNLDTMDEVRTEMSKYYKPYAHIGGRYQANYAV